MFAQRRRPLDKPTLCARLYSKIRLPRKYWNRVVSFGVRVGVTNSNIELGNRANAKVRLALSPPVCIGRFQLTSLFTNARKACRAYVAGSQLDYVFCCILHCNKRGIFYLHLVNGSFLLRYWLYCSLGRRREGFLPNSKCERSRTSREMAL